MYKTQQSLLFLAGCFLTRNMRVTGVDGRLGECLGRAEKNADCKKQQHNRRLWHAPLLHVVKAKP